MAEEHQSSAPVDTPNDPAIARGNRLRNLLIAFGAIVLSVTLFLGWQSPQADTSLEAQARAAVPLEVAIGNGKPTALEFYANWCTSCQAMAGDLAAVKAEYGDRVNFVMLNIDNERWLPEMLAYNIDGIPHFVYSNGAGEAIAETIGEIPRPALEANLDALLAEQPLPYSFARGRASEVDAAPPTATSSSDPRSHSAQANL
ncbi:MAG: thioredoxin domain-containing protein [Cyanobacteria bacterium J06641_5]